ncbi:MAG TPA: ion transporter [Cyclobacteriaceae bacterium]
MEVDRNKFRKKLRIIIFGTITPAGRIFDITILVIILLSIGIVMLESVQEIDDRYGKGLRIIEWILTILFSLEYIARIYTSESPKKYITSFFGIIDLVAILPTYLTLISPGTHYLLVVRALRLLRIFRILKLTRFLGEGRVLTDALWASRHKIIVFVVGVITIVMISGTMMYLIEGEKNEAFTSIPRSIYWAIVTLTTVGYGDIAPKTVLGQAFAAMLMIAGYAIIAVPTGIVTSEIASRAAKTYIICNHCDKEHHDRNAVYCSNCGNRLQKTSSL